MHPLLIVTYKNITISVSFELFLCIRQTIRSVLLKNLSESYYIHTFFGSTIADHAVYENSNTILKIQLIINSPCGDIIFHVYFVNHMYVKEFQAASIWKSIQIVNTKLVLCIPNLLHCRIVINEKLWNLISFCRVIVGYHAIRLIQWYTVWQFRGTCVYNYSTGLTYKLLRVL